MQIIRRDVPDAGGEACRECLPGMAPPKQHRPAITRMHRAASQWMRGLGVPPELIVVGVGNEWTGSVPRFLSLLRDERDPVRMGIRLCTNGFPRAHAFEVR